MRRVRVKFCGVMRIEDARLAVALGVDAIGVVLTKKSARFAGLDTAREIRRELPPFVSAVALFMDDEPGWIAQAIATVQPDLLQFHGAENERDCLRYECPYIKAVPMASAEAAQRTIVEHRAATGFLLDGHAAGTQGGGGKTFDWTLMPKDVQRPVILAGGLTCDNVACAIRATRPYAVDVSSGIESAVGIKDAHKMRRFIEEVERAGSQDEN